MGAEAPVMRLRRPRWKDPRLIVGIVLVVASVLMGALLVSRLAETRPALVADAPIAPGDPLAEADLSVVEVRLGEQADLYAAGIGAVPEGAVAARAVRAGELIPLSAIGQSGDVPLRPVVIPVQETVAESVAPGAAVELWHTLPVQEDGESAEAHLLVADAVVRRIDEGSSLGMQAMAVEVLVPRDDLDEVLEVLSQDGRLDVIGIPGAHEVSP